MTAERPSLLLLNLYMVYPPNSGAKVVIYNRLAELSKSFRITFCCLGEGPSDVEAGRYLGRFAEVVVVTVPSIKRNIFRRIWSMLRDPCATGFADRLAAWFDSAPMRELLLNRTFDIIEMHSSCWHRRSLERVKGVKVLVVHNRELDYYTERARSAWHVHGRAAAMWAGLDALLVAEQERRAVAVADAVVSLAPLEAVERQRQFGNTPVLCNWGGVDLEYYRRVGSNAARSDAPPSPPVLLFIAAFFVEPAIDAALRFVMEALPAIARVYPEVRLRLVGDHHGNTTMVRLAAEHPNIELVGLVSDVRPHLDRADVVVVPIVHGAGVRYKIMEALAAGKPIVSTHKGAEGLGLIDGSDALLADTVAAMAPRVIQLLQDPHLRQRLSENGRRAAHEKFDHIAEHERLAAWYRELLSHRRQHPRATSRAPSPSPLPC